VREPKWYDPNAENPPWIKALAEAIIVTGRIASTAALEITFPKKVPP
jgi:hypothetical protein